MITLFDTTKYIVVGMNGEKQEVFHGFDYEGGLHNRCAQWYRPDTLFQSVIFFNTHAQATDAITHIGELPVADIHTHIQIIKVDFTAL